MDKPIQGPIHGIAPDGAPALFTMSDGDWFVNRCPDCNEFNGMGVINEQHTIESYKNDPYDPTNRPCIWCGKGPMVMEFGPSAGPEK